MTAPPTGHPALDPAVERFLADLLPAPACAVTEAYDMVRWNSALARVVGDPVSIPGGQRNLVRMCFENPSFRERVSSWAEVAESAIAELRVVAASHPHSDRLRQLIDQMKVSNPDFRQAWNTLNVRPFFGEIAAIELRGVGVVHVKVLEFVLREENPITIVVFQPVDAQSRSLLADLVGEENS
ncbi:MmyB family transcriptional regulator [Mycolicibacterium sp. XJ879]